LPANDLLKDKNREGIFAEFDTCLSDAKFPKLKKFATGMASMFGKTYVCEQTFSNIKYVK
jgi:hypothetical protein